MISLLGLSGSLREGSLNTALLRACAELMPADVSLNIGSIREIPLYDGDAEAESGLPPAAAALKEEIAAADGLLLVTPEYNNGIPGVFKNAIDWVSRPAADIRRVFGGKPVAVIGASPGPYGTLLAQAAWLPVLRTLGMVHWSGGRLMVSRAAEALADGRLQDDKLRERLRAFLHGFSEFAGAMRERRE